MIQVKKLLAMPQALWNRVEEYRWRNRIPSESQAMRELLEAGLNAEQEQIKQKQNPRRRTKDNRPPWWP